MPLSPFGFEMLQFFFTFETFSMFSSFFENFRNIRNFRNFGSFGIFGILKMSTTRLAAEFGELLEFQHFEWTYGPELSLNVQNATTKVGHGRGGTIYIYVYMYLIYYIDIVCNKYDILCEHAMLHNMYERIILSIYIYDMKFTYEVQNTKKVYIPCDVEHTS